MPTLAHAYISAVSTMALTISGPPSTTKRLLQSDAFKNCARVPIPVYAPYHAAHLYTDADIDHPPGGLRQLAARMLSGTCSKSALLPSCTPPLPDNATLLPTLWTWFERP